MGFVKITSIIFASVILAVFITFTATKKYYSTQALPVSHCADPIAPPSAISPELKRSASISSVVAENKKITVDSAVPTDSLGPKVVDVNALLKEREAQQQHINSFREFVAADHKKPVIEEANLRFEAEAIDYQWAAVQEDKLLSAFADTASLSTYVPSHMSCRSATCKIVIPAQDDVSSEDAYRSVWQSLIHQNSTSNNTITYFRNAEKGEVVMYISTREKSIFQ